MGSGLARAGAGASSHPREKEEAPPGGARTRTAGRSLTRSLMICGEMEGCGVAGGHASKEHAGTVTERKTHDANRRPCRRKLTPAPGAHTQRRPQGQGRGQREEGEGGTHRKGGCARKRAVRKFKPQRAALGACQHPARACILPPTPVCEHCVCVCMPTKSLRACGVFEKRVRERQRCVRRHAKVREREQCEGSKGRREGTVSLCV